MIQQVKLNKELIKVSFTKNQKIKIAKFEKISITLIHNLKM